MVAATAFGAWARRRDPPGRIVIVGPAHRVAFRGLAIHPATAWSTPLGEAKIARDLHTRLAEAKAATVDPRPFAGEHSLEMHLVMLQAMLTAPFEILPILVGDAEPRQVAEALRLVWGGQETAIAVSSDLSHFLDRDSAEQIDLDTARRIERLDFDSLEGRRACGYVPIMGALAVAAERDLRVSALHLATSADVGAEFSRGGRLRRLRLRIRGLGAAERGRPHGPPLDLHGGAGRGGEAGRTHAGAPHRRPPVARPLRAAGDLRHTFPGR